MMEHIVIPPYVRVPTSSWWGGMGTRGVCSCYRTPNSSCP